MMKIIDLKQGSEEWLFWRKTVITATDCPAILGTSKYCSEFKCWQKKLDLVKEDPSNHFMDRGRDLEPIGRDRFIQKYGINMTPACVESSKYEFLGASLDGISDCHKYILEIKSGGEKLYNTAKEGLIPPDHMHQMQHQLLVTGAEKCFYKVTHEEEDYEIVIDVYPDFNFETNFLPQARAFWRCVALHEEPEKRRKRKTL